MSNYEQPGSSSQPEALGLLSQLVPELRTPVTDERQAELARLAYTDSLTGLPNRRAMDLIVDHLIETEPGTFAVLVADLDDLKLANAQGGHAGGDKYLITTANRLTLNVAQTIIHDSVRTQDTNELGDRPHDIEASDSAAARLGGDEFAVVLRGIRNQSQLTVVNNRLLTNVEEAGINISTGTALHTPGMTKEELFSLADAAESLDKGERRNLRQVRERAALSLPRRMAHIAVEAVRRPLGVDLDRHYRLYGRSSRPQ